MLAFNVVALPLYIRQAKMLALGRIICTAFQHHLKRMVLFFLAGVREQSPQFGQVEIAL